MKREPFPYTTQALHSIHKILQINEFAVKIDISKMDTHQGGFFESGTGKKTAYRCAVQIQRAERARYFGACQDAPDIRFAAYDSVSRSAWRIPDTII